MLYEVITTDLFIRRPVLALVVNLVIIIAGLQAIRTLNVRQYPRSENATVTVTTVYIGASANLVRGFVTSPLERAIAAADGIEYIVITSYSIHYTKLYDFQKLRDEDPRDGESSGAFRLGGSPVSWLPASYNFV